MTPTYCETYTFHGVLGVGMTPTYCETYTFWYKGIKKLLALTETRMDRHDHVLNIFDYNDVFKVPGT